MKVKISLKMVALFLIIAAVLMSGSIAVAANGDWEKKVINPTTINNFNNIAYGSGKYVAVSTQVTG
ncbi:MAG: hypothetical protein HY770_01120, partial [Chitinivibrionia bacterium]|nr:hypothetical protein [Chitinivibrionia bacterium]